MLTYIAETRPDMPKSKEMMETAEKRTLGKPVQKMSFGLIRSQDVR
jgi:hypothetical protein